MPETTVLEQLGADYHVYRVGESGSAWLVQKDDGSIHEVVGEVSFEAHRLSSVERSWDVEEKSSKSLFYAIDEAMKNVEREGLTSCQITTTDKDLSVQGGV
jgi:hypothetical protein